MNYNQLTWDQTKALAEDAIEYFSNNPDGYGCDIHSEIYNSDYYIIGSFQAEEWLKKGPGVFNAINIIQDYENDNFGEVNTDLSQSEHVVNMLVYICGEEILSESNHLSGDCWNERLDEDDCNKIIEELKEKFEL